MPLTDRLDAKRQSRRRSLIEDEQLPQTALVPPLILHGHSNSAASETPWQIAEAMRIVGIDTDTRSTVAVNHSRVPRKLLRDK